MIPPVLVLDLDGTLIDTAEDLVGALNAVMRREGFAEVPFDEAVGMVGNGARAMLSAGLKSQRIAAEDPLLDRLTPVFIDWYAANIAGKSRPFPGAIESLDRFSGAGWRLAVCTNKLEGLSRRLLAALGMADRFAVIAGQDTFGVRKPHPDHILKTVAAAGGDASRAVMVGDSEFDVRAARAARVPVVAVEFGYSTIPAADLGADVVIGRYEALFDAANALIGR